MEDVHSIRKFISQDSPHYAQLVIQQLIGSVERLQAFPQSGRVVPEVDDPTIREVIQGSYRVCIDSFTMKSISSPFTTPLDSSS